MRQKVRLLWSRIRYPLGWWVSALATVIGLTGGVAGLVPLFSRDQGLQTLVQAAALAIIAVVALIFLAVREYRFARARNYESVFAFQQAASEKLRDLQVFLEQAIIGQQQGNAVSANILAQARQIIEQVLDDYANLFSIGTATKCRMCIKLLSEKQGKWFVFALARDSLSGAQNRLHDKRRLDSMLDCLDDNSDFLSLWDPDTADRGYFTSDDLEAESDYRSSSFNYWQNIEGSPNKPARKGWLLPYRSTIVWPIRREVREPLGIDKERCLGFAAVDSASPNAFSERWDVPMGKTLANNLYGVLGMYAEVDRLISSVNEREQRVGPEASEKSA